MTKCYMTETQVVEMNVREILEAEADKLACDAEGNETEARVSIRTFSEAGVMSGNAGLVVRIGDREYQVSIVRSK